MGTLHFERVLTLASEARAEFPSFSNDVFQKLLIKMDRKYNVDRLLFWETMRFSANELELVGIERKVYLRFAAKYFGRNKQIRAARFKPSKPPKPTQRIPGSGAVELEGNQFVWKL